jgi:RNA-directed DNA polymerase
MGRTRERRYEPATVPFAATPAGEPPAVRAWANPTVWTERMLTTLEQGVRGGRWHTLIDKVYRPSNLWDAAGHVIGNQGAAGVDRQTVERFRACRQQELDRLHEQLRTNGYRPQAVKRVWIPKPGSREQRPLGIPTVCDRVVQTALLQVLEPIFDATFAEHSYGFRHGRGCHHALERVEEMLAAGNVFVVDADLKSYFDTIPKSRLMARIREKVSDSRVLRLVEMYLEQGVLDGLRQWTPEKGTPQGAVLSPLLANIYLNPLDHLLDEAGFAMVRYADDFVILCRRCEDADRALELVQRWVEENELALHPTKTRIVDARTEHFDFLGYRLGGKLRLPRAKSLTKLKDTVREKTKRTNGQSMPFLCARLSSQLRGWFTYFRHCHWSIFHDLDGWIRTRLRAILRKRSKRRGRARGLDLRRWTNRFFEEQGLYSLQTAHVRFVQSSRRSTINWKAGCGKSARPVWREGRPNSIGRPYPDQSASTR